MASRVGHLKFTKEVCSLPDPASPSAEMLLALVLLTPGPAKNSNALLCSPGNVFNFKLDFFKKTPGETALGAWLPTHVQALYIPHHLQKIPAQDPTPQLQTDAVSFQTFLFYIFFSFLAAGGLVLSHISTFPSRLCEGAELFGIQAVPEAEGHSIFQCEEWVAQYSRCVPAAAARTVQLWRAQQSQGVLQVLKGCQRALGCSPG